MWDMSELETPRVAQVFPTNARHIYDVCAFQLRQHTQVLAALTDQHVYLYDYSPTRV